MFDITRGRGKNWKRERKTKYEKKSNNIFFSFLILYIEKIIFCDKTHLEKPSLYCYICLAFFPQGRLWHFFHMKMWNKIAMPKYMYWFYRRRTSTQILVYIFQHTIWYKRIIFSFFKKIQTTKVPSILKINKSICHGKVWGSPIQINRSSYSRIVFQTMYILKICK